MLVLYLVAGGGGLVLVLLLIWAIGRTPAGRESKEENRRARALGNRGQRQDWYGKHPDE